MDAGVLIHHFDNQANKLKPWTPCPQTCFGKECWCAKTKDRLSATFINALLPKAQGGRMPTFEFVDNNAAAGFVLSPYFSRVLCSYPGDGGTINRLCHPPGLSSKCVPGCYREQAHGGGEFWCSDDGADGGGECSFRPSATSSMLEIQRTLPMGGGQTTYNEVIVEFESWRQYQPRSIEAVWYMGKMPHCSSQGTAMMCETYARQVHTNFMASFGLTREQFPLLVFDPFDWVRPFSLAPP